MEVRGAERGDWGAVRTVADRSFQASYSLSPEQIEALVEGVFSDAALTERQGTESVIAVAEVDGAVAGFAEVDLEVGALRWLHVDPDIRGRGIGTALVERSRGELADRGLSFTARVLEDASEGGGFLERFGLNRSGSADFEFDGERFAEGVFSLGGRDHDAGEPAVSIPATVSVDGATRPVDRTEEIPGTDAPFFPVYDGVGGEEPYGFFCSNCASTNVAADGLDRLECDNCGNTHLADTWDAAYL